MACTGANTARLLLGINMPRPLHNELFFEGRIISGNKHLFYKPKPSKMKKLSKLVIGLSLSTLCMLLVHTALAQNYQLIAPNNNDNQLAAPINPPVWMNNGIFENSNGTAYAVTWDENGGAVYFQVWDNMGQTTGPITCTGAGGSQSHPDIVVGGDNTNTYVGVVYTNTLAGVNRIYLELYTITNIGTGFALGTTTCNPNVIQVTNTGTSYNPHIDLANAVLGSNTYVTADEFAIAWEEGGCSANIPPVTLGARACAGSLIAFATCASGAQLTYSTCLNVVTGILRSGGISVDIAVNYDYVNGDYISQFVFDDPTLGNLYLGKWDITTGTLTKGLSIDNPGAGNIQYPRIDVNDQTTLPSGSIDKETVYRYWNGLTWGVRSINQLLFDNASAYYNIGTGASNNSKPVVATGTIGTDNQTMSIAYANSGDNNVWLNSIEWTTGALTEIANAGDKDYYRVNSNANEAADDPVAISNNYIYASGKAYADKIFVCWYNTVSQTIDGKATSTFTPSFKPAETPKVVKGNNGLTVYPVPAKDKLFIQSGLQQASYYSINDLLGRVLMEGPITGKTKEINTAKLENGLYLLNITNADKSISGVKITKE